MSVIKEIPKDSRIIQSVNLFTATFNNPTIGSYDFGVAANVGQTVIRMRPQSIFLLEKMSFSANIDEGDFLEAVTTTPQFLLRRLIDGQSVFYKPIPIVSYIDGEDEIAYTWTKERVGTPGNQDNPDELIVDFTGVLAQTAALVGRATIRAQVTFKFYEIINSTWVKRFRGIEQDLNAPYLAA